MPLVRFVMQNAVRAAAPNAGCDDATAFAAARSQRSPQRPGRRRKPTNRKSGYLPDALEAAFSLVGALPRPLAPAVRKRANGRRMLKLRPHWKSGLFVWAFSTYVGTPSCPNIRGISIGVGRETAYSFSKHQYMYGMLFMGKSAVKEHIANHRLTADF